MTTTLAHAWACLTCDDHGTGHDADRQAERHLKATGHPVRSWATPEEGA